MKIICAGPPKTGTKSLTKALTILGFKIHDFHDQLYFHLDEFYDLYYNDVEPDFGRFLEGIDGLVDVPCSTFYEEIFRCYPDAKVILTIRDEKGWVSSIQGHMKVGGEVMRFPLLSMLLSKTLAKVFKLMLPIRRSFVGASDPKLTFLMKKHYHSYNDRVRAVIPAEQLLVFDVTQGWGPLCEFLARDIPNVDFPHENKGASYIFDLFTITDIGRKIQAEQKSSMLILTMGIGSLVALGLVSYFRAR